MLDEDTREISRPGPIVIRPRVDQRVLATGQTRYGKTILMTYFLSLIRRYMQLLIDTKGDRNLNRFADAHGYFHSDYPVIPSPAHPRVIVHCAPDPELLQPLFHKIVAEGSILTYIDELTHVAEPNGKQSGLRSLYATGGDRGCGVWACSQQPFYLPGFVMGQTDMYFAFRLRRGEDRDRMADFIGDAVLASKHLPVGQFFFQDDELTEAVGPLGPIPLQSTPRRRTSP